MGRLIVVPPMPSASYWGLAVAPWADDEVYAVCANWADASCPVCELRDGRWLPVLNQVACYRHDPRSALIWSLYEAIVVSGSAVDDDEAWDLAERLAADAIEIGR